MKPVQRGPGGNSKRLEIMDITLWGWDQAYTDHKRKHTEISLTPPNVHKIDLRIYMTSQKSQRLVDLIHFLDRKCPKDVEVKALAEAVTIVLRERYRNIRVPKVTPDVFDTESMVNYGDTDNNIYLEDLET